MKKVILAILMLAIDFGAGATTDVPTQLQTLIECADGCMVADQRTVFPMVNRTH